MMKKYQMDKLLFAIIVCVITALFSACVSVQEDLHIPGVKDQMEADLSKLERMIVPLEAMGGAEARKKEAELSAARTLITGMEKNAAADEFYMGELTAWSGRLAILEGRYSEARRMYRQTVISSPWNTATAVLGIRLEGDPEKRLELIERELVFADPLSASTGFGELQIEKARAFLELRRFSEAAGAFDAAFVLVNLAGIYRESFQRERDRAWELRGTEGAPGSIEIIEQGGLSWRDCVALAKNETGLLRFLGAGRNTNEAELFNTLLDRAFIPSTQDINLKEWSVARPEPGDIVFRSGAAWFIWRLYAEARADRGLLSRYTARYATGSRPRSPIADIPSLSPFFDSILGCVETEFLALPDGRNFLPGEPMRAADLLAVLKKIDR